MKKRVLSLLYVSENDTLDASNASYSCAFQERGFEAEVLNLRVPENAAILKQRLEGDDIAFCYGLQGIGSRLTIGNVNLWTATRTPFVGLHFDHPAHMPENHISDSPYVANLYYAASFLDVKQNYLLSKQLSAATVPGFTGGMPGVSPMPFEKRSIRLLFLKTGYPLDDLEAWRDALPSDWRKNLMEQVERAWASPNLELCDLAVEIFTRVGVDWKTSGDKFWTIVQFMDRYIRRKRAIEMVEWLKHQEGAVIVGSGWDFIDKTRARSEFRPPVNAHHAFGLYEETQFLCNTNPYGRDIVHERIMLGLATGCCVLSDRNAWWQENFGDVPALTFFDWSRPFDEQLQPMLADLSAAEKAMSGHPAAAARFSEHDPQPVIDFASKIRAFAEQG